MPRLRVLAGSTLDHLVPISPNSDIAVDVSSDAFEGKVAVYIKGFADASGCASDSPYFYYEQRSRVTWSFQMQGRFLRPHSADDILFGNTFARPLKLPWGFGTAVKFMQYVDATLEQDLTSHSKPWALSPLIASMPHLEHRPFPHNEALPPFPPALPIGDDVAQLRTTSGAPVAACPDRSRRQAHFRAAPRRREVVFGPDDLITADFCHNHLHFSPDSVALQVPGGLTIEMLKYWDGQPVRFVCCERARPGDPEPWGRVFWCVVFERVEEEDVKGAGNVG